MMSDDVVAEDESGEICKVCRTTSHPLDLARNSATLTKVCECLGHDSHSSAYAHAGCKDELEVFCPRCHYKQNTSRNLAPAKGPLFHRWLATYALDVLRGEYFEQRTVEMLLCFSWLCYHLLLLLLSIACSSTIGRGGSVAFLEWNVFWRVVAWCILIAQAAHTLAYALVAKQSLRGNSFLARAQLFRFAYFIIPIAWSLLFSIVLALSYLPGLCGVTFTLFVAYSGTFAYYVQKLEDKQTLQISEFQIA